MPQISVIGAGSVVFTATFFMSVFLYPVWGNLSDRYSRKTLISLSGIIWWLTTWLNTVSKTFSDFLITRTLTGIDDTPPSTMNSLISDYFPPSSRGKPLGLISASAALGALIGTILGVVIGYATGWRNLFYFTGGIGILMALLVYSSVKDVPRGSSEPELSDVKIKEELYRINLKDFLAHQEKVAALS